MSRYQQTSEGKDPVLWEIAEKRASFKKHALTYVVMSSLFWAVWFLSSNHHERNLDIFSWNHLPWPVWPMIGWGIGLAFHYTGAYLFPRSNSVESEYEKLKNQQKNR